MTRLSRVDYQRAVEDLLGTALPVSDDLPADNESYSFTHLADLLTISPLLVEKYHLAALALSEEAVPNRHPTPQELFFEGETDMSSDVGAPNGRAWNLWAVGDLSVSVTVERAGEYEALLSVAGTQVGPDPTRFALKLNDVVISQGETWSQNPEYEVVRLSLPLTEGTHTLSIRFLNDYYCTEQGVLEGRCPEAGDRNLLVDSLLVRGPLYQEQPPSSFEARYLTCDWENIRSGQLSRAEVLSCGKESARRFVRLAWRGEPSAEQLNRLEALISAELETANSLTLGLSQGLRQVVHAALLSPQFLMREEPTPAGQALSGQELAARLAALVWRSVPDEALLSAAERGELTSEAGLRAQLSRLLDDPRADTLATEFSARLLNLHHLDVVAPDYAAFPSFDEELRASMHQESERVLKSLLHEDRSLLDLINADFTWLNPRLAEHYGLSDQLDPSLGDAFQRVSLPQGGRLGALTQGAWLTATSHATRTSPVVRGKWVLENLLCVPPPPPPPGVEGLPPAVNQDTSVRARLEQHRADPACAACHVHMDSIGFGLERFDGVGAFRVTDAGRLIETAGLLPPTSHLDDEGAPFEDAVSMARALRDDPRVGRCVAERFLVYALGRGLQEDERCFVDEVINQAEARGMTLRALVEATALSPLLLTRGEVRP